MKVSEAFNSGKFLKAADVPVPVLATIRALTEETMPDGTMKWAAHFNELQKALVLNKVNANSVGEMHGDDSTYWAGKAVEL